MKSLQLDEKLYTYLLSVGLREPQVLRALRLVTERHSRAKMLTPPEQAQFLALLARLIGARKMIEVGVFTGYTTLTLALASPNARIIACDISEEYARIGMPFWKRAKADGRIDLRIGPALRTLRSLRGKHDFAYIDADKESYSAYYEECLRLVRPGGLIAFDNALWGGRVAYPAKDAATRALQKLNARLHRDKRVDFCILPICDGLALARKK